jgi:hypothetical protein
VEVVAAQVVLAAMTKEGLVAMAAQVVVPSVRAPVAVLVEVVEMEETVEKVEEMAYMVCDGFRGLQGLVAF